MTDLQLALWLIRLIGTKLVGLRSNTLPEAIVTWGGLIVNQVAAIYEQGQSWSKWNLIQSKAIVTPNEKNK